MLSVEKRKENISDLPRQGGQKKKMGKHFASTTYMYTNIVQVDWHLMINQLYITCVHLSLVRKSWGEA